MQWSDGSVDGKGEANGGRWDAQDEQQEEEEEPGEERGTVKRRGVSVTAKTQLGPFGTHDS